ncbi:AFG1-like ATPase [Lecanosticta acicola]|uniref:AFG1-like ATPase n=1 Tax=Lecanosticta acicola TaxID=111012 RepID=A0AAI8YVH5_9PEZI|nr:AFG1-like ATPase [Lecanosticta acicola]
MNRTALHAAYKGLIQRGRLVPDQHQAALVTRLANLQDELLETNDNGASILPSTRPVDATKGLYIYGSVGTGKSRLADLFAATLPSSVSRRRIHFHEFMMDVHTRLHRARSRPGYGGDPLVQIGREIEAESHVLCFDEFQVTDIADAMILGRLFGSIWRQGGVMVSTSNRHPNGLYENGLNRDLVLPFIRELQRRCEVWEIGGKDDYRMKGIQEEDASGRLETFFTDPSAFYQSLERALEGRKVQHVSLPVYGNRSLQISAAPSHDVDPSNEKRKFDLVHGTFQDLCEASLGSGDYHALCSSTEKIFLSGLRPFRAGEKDSVRRFITMIDLAYETRTQVICLSSAPLGEVFANIVPVDSRLKSRLAEGMTVKGEGGSSSSMMSTFIGDTEWSATGLMEASLATGGAGETDVGFAIGRAISRLYEMGSRSYSTRD